ncbi:hypothetical protein [Methylobacterium haplocladii]|uniref:Uncharacterized protein n=1 Tax=Methylobacterium haplocladii TaxID=1176176 RepID=A0A512IP35_9HYPH|nr:hypothetical protein [Methylobacterium haplocladii]GEO99422.1 hypothetical protein MHA02_18100 [Methylobacterium haplocladii]GJD83250.1 hypothetical protein HPGCJGGD_1116 [Methylobacterium haplocladii]GLS60670.1 hypothetical protein GCM10007887_33540 [Methylobacterium haplocladii]
MSDPTSDIALLDTRAPDGGKAMQSAFLWVLASLATAIAIFVITLLVWAQNERAAGRMIIGAQKTTGYLPVVASQFATLHGRPGGL